MAKIKDLFGQDPGLEGRGEPEGKSEPKERLDNVIPLRPDPKDSQPQRGLSLRPTSRVGHMTVLAGEIMKGLHQSDLEAAPPTEPPTEQLPPVPSPVSPADALTVITPAIAESPTEVIPLQGTIGMPPPEEPGPGTKG